MKAAQSIMARKAVYITKKPPRSDPGGRAVSSIQNLVRAF